VQFLSNNVAINFQVLSSRRELLEDDDQLKWHFEEQFLAKFQANAP